ncbi:hydrolase [uncultured Oscillibacter sp.]|uniref:hydrolase n=1 Tax=uncultured Oscillibacter sp. TaxID=876091 RepID=UPI0025F824C4|nr:hydrolase [uncultured Oscillibacter sp.]
MEHIARDPKADFLAVYSSTIRRDGAAAMIYWLDCKTDFFTAPASSKHHLAQPGGLAVHSLNVYKRLLEITALDVFGGTDGTLLAEEVRETVAILGLLHDVCKVGVYHQTDPFKAAMEGKLDTMAPYEFRDPFPLGRGEKSLFLITSHMALTEEEALAIRWHMGAYDDAVKGGSRSMTEAMDLTPWVWRLQEADMCAAWIDERSAAE